MVTTMEFLLLSPSDTIRLTKSFLEILLIASVEDAFPSKRGLLDKALLNVSLKMLVALSVAFLVSSGKRAGFEREDLVRGGVALLLFSQLVRLLLLDQSKAKAE